MHLGNIYRRESETTSPVIIQLNNYCPQIHSQLANAVFLKNNMTHLLLVLCWDLTLTRTEASSWRRNTRNTRTLQEKFTELPLAWTNVQIITPGKSIKVVNVVNRDTSWSRYRSCRCRSIWTHVVRNGALHSCCHGNPLTSHWPTSIHRSRVTAWRRK